MRYFLVAFVALLASVSAFSEQTRLHNDKKISFNVFLDAKHIGTHIYTFERTKNLLKVNSKLQLSTKIWGMLPVQYNHESTEQWQDDCLIGLDAKTEERGNTTRVNAQLTEKGLVIINAERTSILKGCIKSFAYWNPRLLTGDNLLNSENGESIPVKIIANAEQDGSKSLLIESSKANIYLDYSSTNQWISLKSQLKVGGKLHYIRK